MSIDDVESRKFVLASLIRYSRNCFSAVIETALETGTMTAAQARALIALFEAQMAQEEKRAETCPADTAHEQPERAQRAALRSVPTSEEQ
ncbi:hypothetical protein [Nocardia altamirensis]|uniref:hypothetical protein n=1 Tax=Nocardia altamirensis TaxID=472158 RepID=UPI00114D0C4A|nr:hypothetical protein [Nocardia altamirensis]